MMSPRTSSPKVSIIHSGIDVLTSESGKVKVDRQQARTSSRNRVGLWASRAWARKNCDIVFVICRQLAAIASSNRPPPLLSISSQIFLDVVGSEHNRGNHVEPRGSKVEEEIDDAQECRASLEIMAEANEIVRAPPGPSARRSVPAHTCQPSWEIRRS